MVSIDRTHNKLFINQYILRVLCILKIVRALIGEQSQSRRILWRLSLNEIFGKIQFLVLTVEPWQPEIGDLSYPDRSNSTELDWVKNTTDEVTLSNETLTQISKGRSYSWIVIK